MAQIETSDVGAKEAIGLSTYSAKQLVALSIQRNETVTECPDTRKAETALLDELRVLGAEGEVEVYGDGYGGSEGRGYTDMWGTDDDGSAWRVHVIHAEAGR
jgi:hypothetical protein